MTDKDQCRAEFAEFAIRMGYNLYSADQGYVDSVTAAAWVTWQHQSAALAAAQEREAKLREALERLIASCDESDGAQYGTLGTDFVRHIARAALSQSSQEQDRQAEMPDSKFLDEAVGRVFFKYWDRLNDPVPEDSTEKIVGELLAHLKREVSPLMRRPWEKVAQAEVPEGWINPAEYLPHLGQEVQIKTIRDEILTAWLQDDDAWWLRHHERDLPFYYAEAWRPLAAPSGKEEQ